MTKNKCGTMVFKWQKHHERTVDKAIDERSKTGENDDMLNHNDVNETGRVWSFR